MPISGGGSSASGGTAVLFSSTLSGAAANIDTGANGIAGTSRGLLWFLYARTAEAVFGSTLLIRFNADSGANYDMLRVTGNNVSASVNNFLGQTGLVPVVCGASQPANVFGVVQGVIPAYANTTGNKAGILTATNIGQAAANTEVSTWGMAYRSTSAISRMSVAVAAGSNLAAGTSLVILGL